MLPITPTHGKASEALRDSALPVNTMGLASDGKVPAISLWILSAPTLVLDALMGCFDYMLRVTGPFWGITVPHHLQLTDPFWRYQHNIATALSLADVDSLPPDIKSSLGGVFRALQYIRPEALRGVHETVLRAVLDDLSTIQTQFKDFAFYPTLAMARVLYTLERAISTPPSPPPEHPQHHDALYPGGTTLPYVARVIRAFYDLHYTRTEVDSSTPMSQGEQTKLKIALVHAEENLDKHLEQTLQTYADKYQWRHRSVRYYGFKCEIQEVIEIVRTLIHDGRFMLPAFPEARLQKTFTDMSSWLAKYPCPA